jgi:hypothetical protein
MRTAGTIAFAVTLATSLATNVALLVRLGLPSNERQDQGARTDSRPAPTQGPLLLPPPTTPSTPSAPQAIDCRHRLDDLMARRAELKKIQPHVSP